MERVGYAFVPEQELEVVYTPEQGLERGTIFPELDIGVYEYVGETMQGSD